MDRLYWPVTSAVRPSDPSRRQRSVRMPPSKLFLSWNRWFKTDMIKVITNVSCVLLSSTSTRSCACLGYARAEALCKEYRQTKGPGTTAKPSEQLFFIKLGSVIKNTLEKCQRENGFMWVLFWNTQISLETLTDDRLRQRHYSYPWGRPA